MSSVEDSEFRCVCTLGSNQLISCYGKLKDEYLCVYQFYAFCSRCKYRRNLEKINQFDPYRYSIFEPRFVESHLKEEIDRYHAKCYVYFISDGIYVKIGVAKNPYKRLIELQTGNGNKLEVVALIPCKSEKSAYRSENWLHRIYGYYRMEGEWFDILQKISSGDYLDNFKKYFDPKICFDSSEPTELLKEEK